MQYTGSLVQNDEKFAQHLTEKVNKGAIAEVLQALINVSQIYFVGARDVESVFNNISRLLRNVKPEEVSSLTKSLSASVASGKIAGFEQSRLKVYVTFHILVAWCMLAVSRSAQFFNTNDVVCDSKI